MHKKFCVLFLLISQILTILISPIPISAQSTTYEEGRAEITNTIPLNHYNASTQTALSEDNTRFVENLGINVSELFGRNINYQHREQFWNDSLATMSVKNFTTTHGNYTSIKPDIVDNFLTQNISLVPLQMDITDHIQVVGKRWTDTEMAQNTGLNLRYSNQTMFTISAGITDGSIIGETDRIIGFSNSTTAIPLFTYAINTSVESWILDYRCNRFGISITWSNYMEYFAPVDFISLANISLNTYPAEIFCNNNRTVFRCELDLIRLGELFTYDTFSIAERDGDGNNPVGIEGVDSRLIGSFLNNTHSPDLTFYPNRFNQVYRLFYEPYQNFESVILSYSQIADPDYISMSYELIGNRWITGESGQIFFGSDDLSHVFVDYSHVKRHILLSGNLMYLAPKEKVEYIAPFTFMDNQVPTDWTAEGFESGHYLGAESFESIPNGERSPYFSYFDGLGVREADIIPNFYDHTKVMNYTFENTIATPYQAFYLYKTSSIVSTFINLECWLYIESGGILWLIQNSTGNIGYVILNPTAIAYMTLFDGHTPTTIDGTYPLGWNHFRFNYNGSGLNLFINGELAIYSKTESTDASDYVYIGSEGITSVHFYLDAFDRSGESNYFLNRNTLLNTIPADNTLEIVEEISGHFHVLHTTVNGSLITFPLENSLTNWAWEGYFTLPENQSFVVQLLNTNGSKNISVVIDNWGSRLWYNHTELDNYSANYVDSLWHRLTISCDPFSLITVQVDMTDDLSATIADFLPTDLTICRLLLSNPEVYIDAIGIAGDRDYIAGDNLSFYDQTLYVNSFANTIFEKQTAGVCFTWHSNHNRYNFSMVYFNFNLTFTIFITAINLYLNGTQIWSMAVPLEVLYGSYLKRTLHYELWAYPYFNGSEYHLGIDFSVDKNRTVFYTDYLDPLNFNLSDQIRSTFFMYDVDVASVIVFTSTIKALLKPLSSTTRLLTWSNRHYLTRKMLYYRFVDTFRFGSQDMVIYIGDSVFERQYTTARSIIPTNLTAEQRIIQLNTTQYNNAECLTKIDLFNKSVQLYSENGNNVSSTLNESMLNDLPVAIGLSAFSQPIPLNSAWWDTLLNNIGIIVAIGQQAASNPIGLITYIATALANNNYASPPPTNPPPRLDPDPTSPGGTGSGYTLPIEHGSVNVGQLIGELNTGLHMQPNGDGENTGDANEGCKELAEIVGALSVTFFGAVLAKKIWELLQLNKAYELCNLLIENWDFFGGINPTTVGNVKLQITVNVNGIFSFSETIIGDDWIALIVAFLLPFLLPIVLGYAGSWYHKKLTPIGIIVGLILDGFSGMLGWEYVIVFAILSSLGAYFLLVHPSIQMEENDNAV